MSRTKNPTLRKRTRELSECAEDARECQLLGYELKDLGSLLVKMAIHMDDLQRKVDSQAEYIKTLNEDRKTEPSDSEKPNNCETCKRYKLTCDLFSEICRYEPKTEPQTWTKENCKGCKYNEYPYDSGTCFVRVCINGNKYEPKTEPMTDCTEALTLLWIKNMVTDEEFYRIDARLKCIPQTERSE